MNRPVGPPAGRRRQLALLLRAAGTLFLVELRVRRVPLPQLCRHFGVGFTGFSVPEQELVPLPRTALWRWWAVETVLRVWPLARRRPCLRRSVALGSAVRELSPVLSLRIVSTTPFVAHAFLVVGGQHLDMGHTRLGGSRTKVEAA